MAQWVEICVDHDEEHAADLAKWRGTLGCEAQETWRRRGAKPVLEFALGARREALLAYLALIPPTKQDSRAVWANWTSKDLVGHLADWEREAIERINAMLEDREPASEYTGDVEAWNMARYSAHTGQSWEAVWNDFRATRRDLMALLRRTDDTALEVRHEGDQGLTPYGWFFMAVDHDREHTGDLIRLLDSDISPEDGPEKGPA